MSELYLSEQLESQQVAVPAVEVIENPYYQEYLQLSQKQWMLSDLLMMDKEKTILANNAQKIKVLNLLYHLYKSAAEAIYAFYIDRKVELFDAHVGESSCQLRALKLTVMLKELDLKQATKSLTLYYKLNELRDIAYNLIGCYENTSARIEGKINLKKFLEKYTLDLRMVKSSLFLVSSYILCYFKENINIDKDIINFVNLINNWKLPRTSAKNIIIHLQRLCSFLSIDYAIQCALELKNDIPFACYLEKDDYGRWVLPSLEITDLLLRLVRKENILVLFNIFIVSKQGLKTKKCSLAYKNSRFEEFNSNTQTNKFRLPVLEIETFIEKDTHTVLLLNSLNEFSVSYVVLASISTHNQYPGECLAKLSQSPYNTLINTVYSNHIAKKTRELRDWQALSLMHGFCKRVPKILAVAHIAASSSPLP